MSSFFNNIFKKSRNLMNCCKTLAFLFDIKYDRQAVKKQKKDNNRIPKEIKRIYLSS